jgi:hypothetical protein
MAGPAAYAGSTLLGRPCARMGPCSRPTLEPTQRHRLSRGCFVTRRTHSADRPGLARRPVGSDRDRPQPPDRHPLLLDPRSALLVQGEVALGPTSSSRACTSRTKPCADEQPKRPHDLSTRRDAADLDRRLQAVAARSVTLGSARRSATGEARRSFRTRPDQALAVAVRRPGWCRCR